MPDSGLKEKVLRHYPSIHAFCKARPELSRAAVYLVLSGKYPGNSANQERRIRNALHGICQTKTHVHQAMVTRTMVEETLQAVRCANCRRLNRRECMICRDQTARESTELYERLYGMDTAMEDRT